MPNEEAGFGFHFEGYDPPKLPKWFFAGMRLPHVEAVACDFDIENHPSLFSSHHTTQLTNSTSVSK